MTSIQFDTMEVIALTFDAVENLQISKDAKVAAIIAAGTTTAIRDGGTINDVVSVIRRNYHTTDTSELTRELRLQVEALVKAARAS